MDKHERPYRCDKPGCEKLRGFTYSGGLVRHEREVHKQHGGPKENLLCPIPLCKRNNGAGFTRKENLNEHLRRVHRQPSAVESAEGEQSPLDTMTSDGNAPKTKASDANVQGEVDHSIQHAPTMETQTSLQISIPSTPNKSRKRKTNSLPNGSKSAEVPPEMTALIEEVERLKADNLDKEMRIQRLEETVNLITMPHQQQLQNQAQQAQMHQ